jgi:uncharacterized protein
VELLVQVGLVAALVKIYALGAQVHALLDVQDILVATAVVILPVELLVQVELVGLDVIRLVTIVAAQTATQMLVQMLVELIALQLVMLLVMLVVLLLVEVDVQILVDRAQTRQDINMIKSAGQFEGMEITFNTTEDCNLACTYCYEINKMKKTLNLYNAKKFIDIVLADPDPIGIEGTEDDWIIKTGVILDFIGGDALMNVKLVEQIIEYFLERAWALDHRWKNRWRGSISTNGTLFHLPEVQRFMEKYGDNLSIGVSIDGCPEIHDKNRIFVDGRGSMATIMDQWPWFVDWSNRHFNTVSTKATLNLDSIPYLLESVKFLHEELNLQQINMNFIMEDMNPQPSDLAKLEEQLSLVKDYIIANRHSLHLSLLATANAGKFMKDDEHGCKGRCGSGSMPALGINGKIYPCFRYLPHTASAERQDFNVGDIKNGFNRKDRFQEVRDASRDKISPDKCKECPIESMCAYCIGGCYAEFGEFKRTTHICEISKLVDKYTKLYWREYDKLEGTHTQEAYTDTWEEWNAKRVL